MTSKNTLEPALLRVSRVITLKSVEFGNFLRMSRMCVHMRSMFCALFSGWFLVTEF